MWYLDGTTPPLLIKIIIFIIAIIVVWFIGFLFKHNLDRISRKQNYEAKNVAKMFTSIAQFLAIAILSVIIFKIESTTILSFSALLGTAIGFGTSIVIGNVVAGFYLISVRPFGIGDLIQVKGTEGIVMEIGLNYTKLMLLDESYVLIPNKSLLDANLINCTIEIDDLKERASMGHEIAYNKLMAELGEQEDSSLTSQIRDEILSEQSIVRYPFTIQIKLNIVKPTIPLALLKTRMDDLILDWHQKLGFKPRYYFTENVARQNTRIILVVQRSQEILKQAGNFLEDLYLRVFEELQEGED